MDELAEYGLVFRAKEAFQQVGNRLMSMVDKITAKTRKQAASAKEAQGAFGRFFSESQRGALSLANSISNVSFSLLETGNTIQQFTNELAQMFTSFVKGGVTSAAAVEESNARLGFSLSKINLDYDKTIRKIDEISLKTQLTRDDLTNMVSDLAIQKIDVFDEALDTLTFTAKDGSKEVITASEAIADAVSFSGKNVRRVMFSIKEAVSEQKIRPGKLLADDLNLSRKELKSWNKELKASSDNQDAFNRLMALVADRVGGTAHAISGTLNFALQQVDDWVQKINSEVFKDALPELRDLVQEVGMDILEYINADAFSGIREAIKDLANSFKTVVLLGWQAVKFVFELVSANPFLIKMGSYLLIATVAFGTIIASALTFMAVILALKAAMLAWPIVIGTVKVAFIKLFTVMLPLTAKVMLFSAILLGLVAIAARLAVGGNTIAETWYRVKLALSAIMEGVKAMNGETTKLSLETSAKLKRAGILDFVWDVLRLIHRFKIVADAAMREFREHWPNIKIIATDALDSILASLELVGNTLGVETQAGVAGADSLTSRWVKAGIAIGEIFVFITKAVLKLIELTAIAVGALAILPKVGEGLADDIYHFFNPFEERGTDKRSPTYFKAEQEYIDSLGRKPVLAGEFKRRFGRLPPGTLTPELHRAQEQEKRKKLTEDFALNYTGLSAREKEDVKQLEINRQLMDAIGAKTSADYDKRLAELLGKEVARNIRKIPLRVAVDGENLARSIEDLAAEQLESER